MEEMQAFTETNTNTDSGLIVNDDLLQTLNLCKRIRRLAALDNLRLDTTLHASGLNLHLIKYLEYNNLDPLEYIKGYLMCLQPFMIERRFDQEKFDGALCIVDNLYRVSVYIKLDTTQNEELVVSFHEDNKNGVAKSNLFSNMFYYVCVIPDCITSKVTSSRGVMYGVDVCIQRGLLKLNINTVAIKQMFKGTELFLAHFSDINNMFVNYCNEYLRDLYVSDIGLDTSSIKLFTVLQELSFTSFGEDIFSNLSLLIDSELIQDNLPSIRAADFAICTYAEHIVLTQQQKDELLSLLRDKFAVSSSKKIECIINRVSDYLKVTE